MYYSYKIFAVENVIIQICEYKILLVRLVIFKAQRADLHFMRCVIRNNAVAAFALRVIT